MTYNKVSASPATRNVSHTIIFSQSQTDFKYHVSLHFYGIKLIMLGQERPIEMEPLKRILVDAAQKLTTMLTAEGHAVFLKTFPFHLLAATLCSNCVTFCSSLSQRGVMIDAMCPGGGWRTPCGDHRVLQNRRWGWGGD